MLVVLSCLLAAKSNYIRWPQLVLCRLGSAWRSQLAACRKFLCQAAKGPPGITGVPLFISSSDNVFSLSELGSFSGLSQVLMACEFNKAVETMMSDVEPGEPTMQLAHYASHWFYMLSAEAEWPKPCTPSANHMLSDTVKAVLCDPITAGKLEARCPGVRYQAFYIACHTSHVTVNEDGNLCMDYYRHDIMLYTSDHGFCTVIEQGTTTEEQYFTLLTKYCAPRLKASPTGEDSAETLMLTFCGSAFESLVQAIYTDDLLGLMILAAKAMLDYGGRSGRHYSDNNSNWLARIDNLKETFISQDPSHFLQLVHILETLYLWNALVGNQSEIRRYLHDCLEAAHRDRDTQCLDVKYHGTCPWVGHTTCWGPGYLYDCTLLPYHPSRSEDHRSFPPETSKQGWFRPPWKIWRRRGRGLGGDIENQFRGEGRARVGVAADLYSDSEEYLDVITLPDWFLHPEIIDEGSTGHGDAQSVDFGSPLEPPTHDQARPEVINDPEHISATMDMYVRAAGEPEQGEGELESTRDILVQSLQFDHAPSHATLETPDNPGASSAIQGIVESQVTGGGLQTRGYSRCAYMLA